MPTSGSGDTYSLRTTKKQITHKRINKISKFKNILLFLNNGFAYENRRYMHYPKWRKKG